MTFLTRLSYVEIDLLAIGAAVLTVFALLTLGSVIVSRRDGGPAVAAGVGIGAVALIFTVLGTMTALDFRLIAGLLALCIATSFVILFRQARAVSVFGFAGLSMLAVSALLLLVSSRQGSEWDEFSHWLHAIRYLSEFHRFPGPPDAPKIVSCCAAYPYVWPLLTYLGQFIAGFKESIPALINIVLLGLFGGLLAELAAGDRRRPNFVGVCVGALLATVLSPAYVSKLVFSSYADCVTAFLVAIGCYVTVRICTALEDRERQDVWQLWISFGLVGSALISAKPANLVLYVFIVAAGGLLALRTGGWRQIRWTAVFAVLLPLIVYGLWRQFVIDHLAGRELFIQAFEKWHIHLIPEILLRAAEVMSKKGHYFGIMFLISIFAVRAFFRCKTELDRYLIVVAVVFLGFNAFLLFTYVAAFTEFDARRVASYWRYNTQLGLAGALVVAIVAGIGWTWLRQRWPVLNARYILVLPVVAVFAAPVLAIGSIRFDIDPTKAFYRALLSDLPQHIDGRKRVSIYDPRGSGLSLEMARYEWRDRLEAGGVLSVYNPDKTLDDLRTITAPDLVLVLSGQENLTPKLDRRNIALLRWDGAWTVVDRFPYPDGLAPGAYP